jgi:2-deoxy-D-gluconate 3-dehydrogenase
MNRFSIKDKKAIVTGAGKGIGLAIAEGFAEEGAEVALVDIDEEVLRVSDELGKRGLKTKAFRYDLMDREQRAEFMEEALAHFQGTLDILVNNAGIQIRHSALDFPLEDWDKVIEVDLISVFDFCQRAGRIMAKQKRGKIINISSINSFVGGINTTAYVSAKGGVALLTKGLANEWSALGINVNSIAPGYMETTLNTALLNDPVRLKELTSRIPIGRWGKPQDLVGAAIFLASAASDYLCGAVIPVDGGYLAR